MVDECGFPDPWEGDVSGAIIPVYQHFDTLGVMFDKVDLWSSRFQADAQFRSQLLIGTVSFCANNANTAERSIALKS